MQISPLRAVAVAIFALTAAPAFAAEQAPPAPATSIPTPPAPPAPAAQSATPPAASADGFGGPVIPGVCLLSRETVFTQSQVGQAASARLKLLGQKAQASLEADRRRLEAEAKALQGQQMTPQQGQHRQQQLQARAQALQGAAAQASRELEATRAKATGLIAEAVQPVVVAVYQSKGCGLLLSREAVLGGNMANDLTPAVLQGLNAKMTTITFEREHLPPVSGER